MCIRDRLGVFGLLLDDEQRGWFKRLNQNGPRGRSVEVYWLIGLTEPPWLYQTDAFDGTTQAVRFLHDEEGAPETRLVVMDKLYYTRQDRAESTSNAYQRSLDPDDDSHVIAHSARNTPWHRTGTT